MLTIAQVLFTVFMYLVGGCLFGAALIPSMFLLIKFWAMFQPVGIWAQAAVLSFGFGFGFFLFGICLVLETVILRFLLGLRLKEGEFPFFSLQAVKWAFVNALILVVKITFMDYMKLTPLLPFYYRLMGAKMGRGVQINSNYLADVSLMEIGDESLIGGDAVLIGHIAEGGVLKLKKTTVGRKVTIGLESLIMPGCRIGDGALIAARSVLPKYTVVPARALFAGTPARFIRNLDGEGEETG